LKFHRHPVDYYVQRLQNKEHFAFPGYSDAEWFCILGHDTHKTTGQGQQLDDATGRRLLRIIKRRCLDSRFLFAVPECMWHLEDFQSANIPFRIQRELEINSIEVEFYERDMVLDDLAEHAGLAPWIRQLRKMRAVMIGNAHLREIDFLRIQRFIEIPPVNLHLDEAAMSDVINQAKDINGVQVFLFSAGIASAILIDGIADHQPNSSLIDCGSIWDAFVGIGGQREWRRKLYKDPEAHRRWLDANLLTIGAKQ